VESSPHIDPEGSSSTTNGTTALPGNSTARRLGTMRYRVWQFRQAVTLHRLDQEDYAIVRAILPPDGQRLFASMSESDQHHSLQLYRALRSRGCADKEMLAAALLHDSGKGAGRVQLWVRPLVVLARAFAPMMLSWLARDGRSRWRRPFYLACHHAAIGADLAAAAGLPERTVLLIRTHHQPDGPAALLHALDEEL
jgi:hypothetical protein